MSKYDFKNLPFREWRFYLIKKEDETRFRKAATDFCGRQKNVVTMNCKKVVRIDKDGKRVFLGFDVYKNN